MQERIYRNLIFDFGGVIIDIDFQRTINSFIALGATQFNEVYSKATQSGLFDKLDKGEVSEDDFVNGLRPWLPANTSRQQIIAAWNDIIIGIPERRIRLLESLKPNYRLFLLSNTNITHYNQYIPELKSNYGYDNLNGLFEEVFLSFKLGMRKPDRNIFDYVFSSMNIKKEETLFIDDSKHIIEAAQSYGIQAFWLKDGMDVTDLFADGKLKVEG